MNDIITVLFFTLFGIGFIYFGIKHNKEKHEELKNGGIGGNGSLGIGAILFFLPHWVYKILLIGIGAITIVGVWYLAFFAH